MLLHYLMKSCPNTTVEPCAFPQTHTTSFTDDTVPCVFSLCRILCIYMINIIKCAFRRVSECLSRRFVIDWLIYQVFTQPKHGRMESVSRRSDLNSIKLYCLHVYSNIPNFCICHVFFSHPFLELIVLTTTVMQIHYDVQRN